MAEHTQTILVVEDDPAVAEALVEGIRVRVSTCTGSPPAEEASPTLEPRRT